MKRRHCFEFAYKVVSHRLDNVQSLLEVDSQVALGSCHYAIVCTGLLSCRTAKSEVCSSHL